MGLGGIETMTLRMAQNKNKFDGFIFLFLKKPKFTQLLDQLKATDSLVIDNLNLALMLLFGLGRKKLLRILEKNGVQKIDCIYAFNIQSLVFALFLRKILGCSKICVGVYHPNEYLWEKKHASFMQKLSKSILDKWPASNLFFMNAATKEANINILGDRLAASPIVNVMVDIKRFSPNDHVPKKYKIVSVGRITGFKTYNFYMLPIIKKLHKKYPEISYHIYGHGELEERLVNEIKEHNAEQFIHFHGPVAYDELPHVFSEAYLFIGCGTALVEAAAAGVPSLIALLTDRPLTYGWFGMGSDYNFGEYEKGMEFLTYPDLIEKLIEADNDSYVEVSKKMVQSAEKFSIENGMSQFIDCIKKAENIDCNFSRVLLLKFLTHFVFWRMANKFGIIAPYQKRYLELANHYPA
jgi:glycosyltransferase involved in cell wall biosynthesis